MPQYRALHTKLKLNNKQKSLLAQHPEAARFTGASQLCKCILQAGEQGSRGAGEQGRE